MKTSGRRRYALLAIAALLAVAGGGAWFGDLSSAVPIDVHQNGGGEPLLQPPSAAVALVERALAPYGGLPHDAQLTEFAFEQAAAISPAGATAPTMVVGFDPTYEPRDALLWKDHILARVEAVTQQTCLDGGTLPLRYEPRNGPAPTCRRYVLTFPLHVTWLKRTWQPWIVRRMIRWRERAFAPAVAPPASITTICRQSPDVGALRRVVAAVDLADYAMSQIFDRKHTEPLWTRAAALPGATIARWSPPYPTVPLRVPTEIVAAVVSDAPPRMVTVRFAKPIGRTDASVLMFQTTDDEPICGQRDRAPEPTLTRPPPAWDSVVATVRVRAETEMHWRAAGRRTPGSSRVASVDRHPGAISSVVVETAHPFEGRWRARFTVDERVPEIRQAEFARTGD